MIKLLTKTKVEGIFKLNELLTNKYQQRGYFIIYTVVVKNVDCSIC